jgi:outer membrane protein insertion porin family
VPIPDDGWRALANKPMEVLERGADVRLVVREAELAAFEAFLPAMLAPVGTLQLDAAYRNGSLGGRVWVRNAASRPIGPLGVVQEINGDVELDGRKLVLRSVSARVGGQPVSLTGMVAVPPEGQPRLDLALRGSNLPFVRQTGLIVRGDLDLRLRTPTESAPPRISGTVRLRDSLFLRDVRALIPAGGVAGGGRRIPYFSVDTPPASNWQLDVDVVGEEFMRLRTPIFIGEVSASFRLRGTLAEPRATGRATIDEGHVRMPFARFEVQQGHVRIIEENPYEPVIYLRGTTRRFGYDITMEIEGPAGSPNVEFTSRPPLDSEQVLLMVTAGIAPSEEITYSTTQRATRIGAYLGRSLIGSLGGSAAGADRLSIETGREISRQGRETYNVEYEISDRWTALGEYNEFDEYNAGLRWRLYPREKGGRRADGSPPERHAATERDPDVAVRGAGWLKNRELRISLERLLPTEDGVLDANAIEDASVIVLSALSEEGFREPQLEIEAILRNGTREWFAFDPTFSRPLPRPLAATRVNFHLSPGIRWYVNEVTITGLTVVSGERARAFFRSEQTLLATAAANAYTPGRVNRGESALLGELQQRGYIQAEVNAEVAEEDNGAVNIAVRVTEGPRWEVSSVRYQNGEDEEVELPNPEDWAGQPLTPTLEQDLREAVRHAYYRSGYPDVGLHVESEPLTTGPERVEAGVVVTIVPGPRVTIGEIRFAGNERTRESVLRRRVQLDAGDPLDPLSLERARYRLSRLGVFSGVDLHYEPDEGDQRDPVFVLEEAPRLELALLMGYGSYEQLRAGVEVRQTNLFRLAHQGRFKLVQSLKSSSADFTYGVPELFGELIDGSADLYALRREEVAFLREELGTSFTLRRPITRLNGEATARYSFEALRHRRSELARAPTDERQVNVASLAFSLTGDTRDNPLRPRSGYSWLARLEAADPSFGGEATYQRFEIAGGYHTRWGSGRWIHAGLSHGAITTFDGDDSTLPVNRRFYPGGDNSIRGYQSGEAAPRDAEGRFIGAKSFLLLNFEVEQALMPSWSLVAFVDALGTAAALRDYPFGRRLYSAGLGIRYQTLIGPIRLEYGRNIKRRPDDPSGTLHFSIGYPF